MGGFGGIEREVESGRWGGWRFQCWASDGKIKKTKATLQASLIMDEESGEMTYFYYYHLYSAISWTVHS